MTELDIPRLSRDEAVRITNAIVGSLQVAWDDIVTAYKGRAWEALDYPSWDAYCAEEFGAVRLRLPAEERESNVASLRAQGLSMRAIASATGGGLGTVHRDLTAGVPNGTPAAPVTGLDGKTYNPPPPPVREEIVDAEIVEEGEITDRDEQGPRNRVALYKEMRKPVADAFRASGRLVDLTNDSRVRHSRKQIEAMYGGQLRIVHERLAEVIAILDKSKDATDE